MNSRLLSDPILYRCTLAEEIGHHIMGIYSNLLNSHRSARGHAQMAIDEMRGQIWAVNFLVPKDEFNKALKTLDNPSTEELAQYFRVIIDFILIRYQLR